MNINKMISSVCVTITVICVAVIGVMMPGIINNLNKTNSAANSGEGSQGNAETDKNSCADLPEITSLTKEQAFAYLKEANSDEIRVNIWCDFVPEDIIGTGDYFYISMAYSHTGKLDKKRLEDGDIGLLLYDYETEVNIDDTNAGYAVISGKMKQTMTMNSALNLRTISFNQDYVDYHEETSETTQRASDIVFKNKDKNFISLGARIIALASGGSMGGSPTNLWKHSLEDVGDDYEFTFSYFGVGMDQANSVYSEESGWNMAYAINLIESKYVVNKTTGVLKRIRNSNDNGYLEILKSYTLTEDETKQLMSAGTAI